MSILELAAWIGSLSWGFATIWYAVRAKWWSYPEGRNAIATSFFVTILLARLAIAHATPDYVDTRPLAIIAYVGIALVGLHRLYLIERAQRTDSKDMNKP